MQPLALLKTCTLLLVLLSFIGLLQCSKAMTMPNRIGPKKLLSLISLTKVGGYMELRN